MISYYVRQDLRQRPNSTTTATNATSTVFTTEADGKSNVFTGGSYMFGLLSDTTNDFTQGLLNITDNNSSGVNSPVSHFNLNMNRTNTMNDSKPTYQKKYLL